jgi:hypothetical protein
VCPVIHSSASPITHERVRHRTRVVVAAVRATGVRPPQLTDTSLTGRYRTAYGQDIRGGWSVPRADVAHLMFGVLGQPETIHQVIGIAS